jgi:hypothetical protein
MAKFHGVPEELILACQTKRELADLISVRMATKVLAKVS